jgi:PAS domain S-box-containing protein
MTEQEQRIESASQKQAVTGEASSPDAEAKLRLGLAVAGIGLGSIDYLAGTISLDEAAAALFVLPADTPIPRSDVHSRFHRDDLPVLKTKIAEVLDPAGSGIMAVEHRVVRPDGTTRWLAARKHVEFAVDAGTKRAITGLLAVRDISDRKAAEDALSISQARYRSALAAGRMGTWEADLQAKTRTWSKEAMALFGFDLADGRGQIGGDTDEFRTSLHPEDRHLMQQLDEQADRDDTFTADYRIIRPDGTIRWLSGHGQVVARGADGNAHHLVNIVADVTDRKVAEGNLRVSEVRYRRLFEAAQDGVLLVDPGTRKITDANPFMSNLLGYSHDQLVGKELYEIGLLEDETASQIMFQKLTKEHSVRYEGLPLEGRDGKHHDVEVVANLYDEDGHSVIQCNIRDITQRKLSEAALRQNQALFSTLIEQAPMGVYVIDDQFCMQQVNSLALPVLETVQPLIGRDFNEVLSTIWGSVLGKQLGDIFRHTLKTGERYISPPFSEQRQDLDTVKAYDWETQRVTLPDGRYGVVCYFSDVTERKRAEQELHESEARMRHAADAAGLTYVEVDFARNKLLRADNFANVMGYAAPLLESTDFTGGSRRLLEHVVAGDRHRVSQALDEFFGGKSVGKINYRVLGDDQIERWIESLWSAEFDSTGTPLRTFAVNLDITEKKRAEEQIRLLMAEVNHRAKNLLAVVLAVTQADAAQRRSCDLRGPPVGPYPGSGGQSGPLGTERLARRCGRRPRSGATGPLQGPYWHPRSAPRSTRSADTRGGSRHRHGLA